MRTAILSALLAVTPIVYAWGEPVPNPPAGWTAIDQQQTEPPATQSPKPLATGTETDPLKLAAPPSTDGVKIPPAAAADKTYVIGAEDQLHVEVWGNPALGGNFIVGPDGRISLSLINEIMASGMTREALQADIVRRLKDGGFLRDPTVTVNITAFNSKRYSILGEVNKNGNPPLVVPTTVLEALVNAGGFKDFANKKKIRIMRGTKTFYFNYNQVIAGKNRDQNILLEPGDVIIVK